MACPGPPAISTSGCARRRTTPTVPLSDLSVEHLTRTDTVLQMGLPPARIDILSGITGVSFADMALLDEVEDLDR